jgi:hypothetical protein
MGLVLDFRVEEPSDIEGIALQMQVAASVLGAPVETSYRGVRLRAVPGGDPKVLAAMFQLAVAVADPLQRFATSEGGEAPTNPVPASVSDRQFAQALAEVGDLPWDIAEEWAATGTVPEAILAILAAIPDELTRNRASMFLRSAQIYERHHPMTETLLNAMGKTADESDNLWRLAATL